MVSYCKKREHAGNHTTSAGNHTTFAGNHTTSAGNHTISAGKHTTSAGNHTIITEDSYGRVKCESCYKTFTSTRTLESHRNICQALQHPFQCPKCKVILSNQPSKSRHMKTCGALGEITGCSTQSNISITNNIQSQQNILIGRDLVTNIVINNVGEERIDHMSPDFLDQCVKSLYGKGVCKLLELKHFNMNVPENHNVRMHSAKRKQVKLRENNQWKIHSNNVAFDKLITSGCDDLQRHYINSHIIDEDIQDHNGIIGKNLIESKHKEATRNIIKQELAAMIADFEEKLKELKSRCAEL
jgi:hypothetical protein